MVGTIEKLSSKEARLVILDYMIRNNRPYNSTDIHNNISGNVSKPVVVSIMDGLVKEDLMVAKPYGKQTIYFPKQSKPQKTEEERENIKKSIINLQDEIENLTKEMKLKQRKVQELNSRKSFHEIQECINKKEKQKNELLTIKTNLENEKATFSKEEVEEIANKIDKTERNWAKKKKQFFIAYDLITQESEVRKRIEDELGFDFADGL